MRKYFIYPLMVYIVGALIVPLINYYVFGIDKKDSLRIDNSPGSINTLNQKGGSNIINNFSPKPSVIEKQAIELNIPHEGYYQQTFSLKVTPAPYGDEIGIKEGGSKKLIYKLLSVNAEGSGIIMGASTFSGSVFRIYTISFLTYKKIQLNDIDFDFLLE